MLPIGPLMKEHRVIEKLMPSLRQAIEAGRNVGRIEPRFLDIVLDFIRTYADRCHHGKEEGILFRALDHKPLAAAHRTTLEELIEEHRLARQAVRALGQATESLKRGDASALLVIVERLEFLAKFYPAHILKEDKVFFLPAMDYFDERERAALIEEEREFDGALIHLIYREKALSAGTLRP